MDFSESNYVFLSLFNQTNDIVILISQDRKILAVNHRTVYLSGFAEYELVGGELSILLSREEFDKAVAGEEQFVESGTLSICECRMQRKDGSNFPIEMSLIHVADSEGNFLYYQGVGKDIGGRKQVENSLVESEYRFRALFEQNNDAVFIVDLDGNIQNLNPFAAGLVNYSIEELLGMPSQMIIAPDEFLDEKKKLALLFEGKPVPTYERNLLCKDGSTIPTEINLTLVLGPDQKPVGTQSIVRDITERKNAEKLIRENTNRYRTLFDQSGDAIFIIDIEGFITDVNLRVVHLLGYGYDDLIGKRPEDLVPPSEFKKSQEEFKKALLGIGHPRYEGVFERKDRSVFPAEIDLTSVRGIDGKIKHVQYIVRDITERKAVERALKESEYRYRALFDQSMDAVFISDLDGVILDANQSAANMLGYPIEELIGLHLGDFSSPDEKIETEKNIAALLAGELLSPYEGVAVRKNGETFPVEIRAVLVKDAEGEPLYIQSVSHDITHRKNIENQLQYLAHHDPLTGLPNRSLFFDRLNHALTNSQRSLKKVAVIFIDLDGFKSVNDSYGHAIGDRLLEAIAEQLLSCSRESDTVARMGGDEFTLILENLTDVQQAQLVAERILETFAKPILIGQHSIEIGASLGISISPEHGNDSEHLLGYADNAMYRSKQKGKNSYSVYEKIYREGFEN